MLIDVPSSPPEVARLLKVKPDSVRAWIERGELEAVNLATPGATRPRWRVMPDALERFLDSRSNRAAAKQKPRRSRRKKSLKLEFLK